MSIAGRLANGLLCVESIHPPVCPSIHPFAYLSTHLSTFPYTCLFTHLSIHSPSIHPPSTHSFIQLPVFPPACPLVQSFCPSSTVHLCLCPFVISRSSHPLMKTPKNPSQAPVCTWRTVLKSGDDPLLPGPCLSPLPITDSRTPLDEALAWSRAVSFRH